MILAILQARMTSSRLPGKVIKSILGKPMLLRHIERINRSTYIDKLLVATSADPTDDVIENICRESGIEVFRGSLDDVLDRYYQAACLYNPEVVVRLTGDCPLADPLVIDEVIRFYLDNDFDYVSNCLTPTFPDGLDTEVFSFDALRYAWEKAKLFSERDNVTPFIYKNSDIFKFGNYRNSVDLSQLRWTVDEAEDFELVTIIYEALYPKNNAFVSKDILNFLEKRPELKLLNRHYRRNEGYLKSLEKDCV
jgi:spore coat polysaccharide biosynthesis protein SpsF